MKTKRKKVKKSKKLKTQQTIPGFFPVSRFRRGSDGTGLVREIVAYIPERTVDIILPNWVDPWLQKIRAKRKLREANN